MNVLVAGGTGLVGSLLIEELAKDKSIKTIFLLSRRSIAQYNDKVVVLNTDFSDLENVLQSIEDIEAVYSCLGTTKAQTPDKSTYEKIEIHYPLQIAKWAREHGVSQFHYISSIGTSIAAKNEYLSRKAVAEQELIHAQIPQVFIYRPSFIIGKREHRRIMEQIGGVILKIMQPLLIGKVKKYRAIPAHIIAKTMAIMTTKIQPGAFVLESDEIASISNGKESWSISY